MTTAPARRRQWLGVALVVSVVLNAFLIGAATTDIMHGWPFRGPPSPFRFELGWLKGRLPAEGFDTVKSALEATRPSASAHFQRLFDLRNDLGRLVAVPEPDRAAIDAKLAEIRNELASMQAEMQRTSTDALLSLPADMRASLAEPARRKR